MAESRKSSESQSSAEQNQRELELLCLELENGNLSAEQFARLESLLLDRPELQDVYCQLASLNSLLRAEFGEQGLRYPSLLTELSTPAPPQAVGTVTREACSVGSTSGNKRLLGLLTVSAAVVAIIGGYAIRHWTVGDDEPSKANHLAEFDLEHPTERQRITKRQRPAELALVRPEYVAVRSREAIDLLQRVTNASWRIPPRSPSTLDREAVETMSQGVAQLSPFNGQPAGGYITVLPPGAELELTVFSDSVDENALAIMELDGRGLPTGQLVSFSNQTGARTAENSRLYGQLGTWSERNNSDENKYFLLTAMQQIAKPENDPDWFVADFSVLVKLPHLLHIGWDDSGWVADPSGNTLRDKDYNDIAATIRIRRPEDSELAARTKVQTFPRLDEHSSAVDADAAEIGFPITLPPGQGIVVTASCSARLHNSFSIVDRASGRVLWRRSNAIPDQPQLGAYVIENHAEDALTLAVVGRHQEDLSNPDSAWLPSSFRVFVDDDRCQTIGFEDLGLDEDWDDVRVNVHWISD